MTSNLARLSAPLFAAYLLLMSTALATDGTVTIAPLDRVDQSGEGRENMIENQTRNRGLLALPAPGKVVVDGDLSDWDLTGRMSSFADFNLRNTYSVDTAMMWDQDRLYVAFLWTDRTPLVNMVDPVADTGKGWQGDSVQMRMLTDKVMWITGWFYTKEQRPAIVIDTWKDAKNYRAGLDHQLLVGEAGSTEVGNGIRMAFKKTDVGYTQEISLPWEVLYKAKPQVGPGLTLRTGFEYFWAGPSGKDWPEHRYADNLQPGQNKIQFFWTGTDLWGDVTLAPAGRVAMRQYRAQGDSLNGPVQLSINVPAAAKRFTVVIDDEHGRRVRNLAADLAPEDYAVANTDGRHVIHLRWDGRDDRGQPVAKGRYRVRGLYHEGLVPVFDSVFYNPGTPPWKTAGGSGAWGADHTPPYLVSRAGDRMILGWQTAEGGDGIIGLSPDGRKAWGDKRGSVALASDDEYAYSIMNAHRLSNRLVRYAVKDGDYRPFVKDGKELPFEVRLDSIIPGISAEAVDKQVRPPEGFLVQSLSCDANHLYLSLTDQRLAIVRKSDLTFIAAHPIDGLGALASAPDGTLYALVNGTLNRVDATNGTTTPIPAPGLGRAGSIACDVDGNVLVMDVGPDQQIKVYSPAGKALPTLAQKGGRPIRGNFQPQALSHVSSIAADNRGNAWAVENWNYPRRVSVWGKDGQLVRDYIGGTGYAGVGGYLHDQDATLGYVGPIEMKIDRANHGYHVTRVLWVADPSKDGEPASFNVNVGDNVIPKRFRSNAGGVEREFMFRPSDTVRQTPTVLFMEDDNGWRPVSAMGHIHHLSGEIQRRSGGKVTKAPSGEYAGLNAKDAFYWNDLNEDGCVQRVECVIIPQVSDKPNGWAPLPLEGRWNNTINTADLSFVSGDIYRTAPDHFTTKGAPVYLPSSTRRVADASAIPSPAPFSLDHDHVLVALGKLATGKGEGGGLAGFDASSGRQLWRYPNPYPGVHSSHAAPMASPGTIIGPLRILGQFNVKGLGDVFGIRGNLGEDYYLTGDGLYVGAVFRDGRFPSAQLPSTVAELEGRSMADHSEGGEPFSGSLNRQSDGKIRLTTSIGQQSVLVVELKGFDSVRRFDGPAFTVDDAAEAAIAAYQPASTTDNQPKEYTVTRAKRSLSVDNPRDWSGLPQLSLSRSGSPENALIRLAYDDANLYVACTVTDDSPLKNEGKDFRQLFKTGDAVDLQIGPKVDSPQKDAGKDDSRVLFSMLNGRPVAVLMDPVAPGIPVDLGYTYNSPVGSSRFDRVQVRDDIAVSASTQGNTYTVRAVIPWKVLGITPASGLRLSGDFGFISSDSAGRINVARTYWSNRQTGLVNDLPEEARLTPAQWGTLKLE
ncbi:hypothetical protein DB346_15355 [Verrucomicrobia bacterium LW23]|nr:hypothetical protein DB346_15355 [Verrucomicrobia bacterium LW23]